MNDFDWIDNGDCLGVAFLLTFYGAFWAAVGYFAAMMVYG